MKGRTSPASDGAPDSMRRNAVFSFASQLVTASLTAVLTLVLVRALGPQGYGVFALALSVGLIVLVPADFGLSPSTARFLAERRGRLDKAGALYVDALKLKLVLTAGVCVLLAVMSGPISDAYGEPALEWPLRGFALATLGQSVLLMSISCFTALGKAVVRLRIVTVEAVIEVSASIVLVLLGAGATGAAFGRAAGYVTGGLLSVILVLRLLRRPPLRPLRPPESETVRRVGRYASSLLVVDAAYVLSSNANVLLIGAYLSAAATGIFQAPMRLIVMLQYPGLALASAIAPRLATGPGQTPDVDALSRGIRLLILLQSGVVAPLVIWGNPLMDLLLGPGYEEAGAVIAVLAPYAFFIGFAPLLSTSVNYLGGARQRIPIGVAALALTVLTAVTLIPSYGLVGAAIATDISYGFYTIAHLWLCRRLLGLRLGRLLRSLIAAASAAVAMGLVLTWVGKENLGLVDAIWGSCGGLLVYVAVLFAARELTPSDVSGVARLVRAARRGEVDTVA